MNKRDFIKTFSLATLGTSSFLQTVKRLSEETLHLSPIELADNKEFWNRIRMGYRLKPDYINLENGYYCHLPEETLENFIHHVREVNYQASHYMRTNQWKNKASMAAKLANIAGVTEDELIITRNTTESLDTIISGFPWKPGDEAIMAEQDYGAMLNQFKLMERRQGIVSKVVSVPNHPESDEEIVNVYKEAITPRTKLLMVCHMINITGHILPIRKIADMAHSYGVDVMVDGAHAFGHFEFNIPDLHCDYYGTSLHKWMSVPLGAGFLYVKKDKISKIWPMFAEWNKDDDDIRKLNHTGTHPVHTDLAIGNAVEYYTMIGGKRKEERLRYLQRYWSDQLRDYPKVNVNTPLEPHRSCGIANVGIEGMKPSEMAKILLDKYRIWTVAINGPVYGCRITPNIYTTTDELDQLVYAVKEMADKMK